MFVQVALDVPLFTTFAYRVPDYLEGQVEAGQLVQVPFRNRAKTGLIMSVQEELEPNTIDEEKVRDLVDVIDRDPLLSKTGIDFLHFVADYYLSPIGEVMRLALPSAVRAEGLKHYRLRRDAPPSSDLSEDLRAAFALLCEHEQLAVRKLKASHRDLTFHRLTLLESQGYVDVIYEDESSSPRILKETYYRLSEHGGDDSRLGKKQALLLEHIAENPSTSLTQLKERVTSPQASLKSLEARGLIESWQKEIYRDPFINEPVKPAEDFALTPAQQAAVDEIASARDANAFKGFVLHGVTGSGKTEVYVRVIKETLEIGRRALVLLPEIALTPQFVAIFRGHFGASIAVLHSGLTQAEKFDQWRRIKRNEVDIVIGARSAIFAPIDALGVIIVDEEHDSSFKQEEGTRYNARDMALVRGKLENAQVILGSATPLLESYYGAKNGRMVYLSMPERVQNRPLPYVELVDLRTKAPTSDEFSSIISSTLTDALDRTLADGMQAILFLNRRGYSPCVLCECCGYRFGCPNCDVSLTYHRWQEALRCHHCDYSLRLPETCPKCLTLGVGRKGVGTEKLEDHLRALYPHAAIGRLDRDTGSGKNLRRILQEFREEKLDILVGTQMVTKGHDFPSVTTVGVVSADMSLNFPDFRAAERTFQLLAQVAGRAGRGEQAGQVFIQTYMPEHYSLDASCTHDYQSFVRQELIMRRELGYPPFSHLISIKFEAASDGAVIQAARDYASAARKHLRNHAQWSKDVSMLGPAMAPIARIKNRSRWQLLLKSASRKHLRQFTIAMLDSVGYFNPKNKRHQNVRIIVDVDPNNML